MLKSFAAAAMLGALAMPAFAATETFKDVPMIDTLCSRAPVAQNPDSMSRTCALACQRGGYGILDHGKFIKFDANGNKEIFSQLKASHQTDHLRVNVKGNVVGDHMTVTSVKLL